jgi:hypothetical protein
MKSVSTLSLLLGTAIVALATSAAGEPATKEPTDPAAIKNQQAEHLRSSTTEAIIASARDAVRTMGTSRARLIKRERIHGALNPPQTIDVPIRLAPRAVRLEYVAGPKSGRKVIWREDHRPGEIQVREGGIMGLTSLWLDASGSLTRSDTNHSVSEIGFANILDVMERDIAKAKPAGGHVRTDTGLDANGLCRIEWKAPSGARGLYAHRLRMAIDLSLHLPVEV